MADTIPITGLGAGVVKITDIYPAVDTTDHSQAPTGTTKKYSISQLSAFLNVSGLSIGGVLFGSASGNIQSNNTKFIWDNTNFRLGIGGAIVASNTLTVNGGSYFSSDISQVSGAFASGATTIQFTSLNSGIIFSGATGILSSGILSGDVTTSANSLASTISNQAVTYAKIQDISTNNRLLGRSTAGAGSTQEITVGSGLSLSGGVLTTTSAGDVTGIIGTANQVLANGTFGSSQDGEVTLTLPQDISTTSSPTFSALTLTTPLSGANGGTGIANTGLTINLSSGSTIKVMGSDSNGNASWTSFPAAITYQSFTNASTTTGISNLNIGFYIRNSNSTVNNWMTMGFLTPGGNVGALVGAQVVNQSLEGVDLVFFAKANIAIPLEGMRLVGATNTLTLANALTETNGGTHQSSYTTGDLLQASATNILSKLSAVATGNALISGGSATVSSWGKIGLTTHISGTLGTANGGSGTGTTFTQGSIVFSGASGIYTQDNPAFFWDITNHRLGIGTSGPSGFLDVSGSATNSGAIYGALFRPQLTETGNGSGTCGVYIGGTHVINGSGSNGVSYLQIVPVVTATTAVNSIVGMQIFAATIFGAALTGTTYGISVTGTQTVGAGGLTNSYAAAFFAPTVGTNKTTLYSDDISVGYANITPPANGIVASGKVLFGTLTSPATTTALTLFNTVQNSSRITLSGQEFYQASQTSSEGVAFLCGTNRSGNRQLWIADSALLTQNTTNQVIRIGFFNGVSNAFIDSVATDGVTALTLSIQSAGGALLIGGNTTLGASSSNIHVYNTQTSTTASTTAGGFVLPALAAGYEIVTINGTARKRPYWAT